MEVFVIPIGRDRHELYCEVPNAFTEVGSEGRDAQGWFARMRARFTAMVREAEERESTKQELPAVPADAGWWERVQHQSLAWIAERIAEQRLLWNLRHQTAATLVHASDMSVDQAMTVARTLLKHDHDRHVRWLVIDGLLAAVLGPLLFFVPGPNVVAYYFLFRAVGHLFSMRGAAQGLRRVAWTGRAEPRLVDLRQAVTRAGGPSAAELQQIAADLELPKLTGFVERLRPR